MFSNFNENWYLGLFWSEELIVNDEHFIQGHFYDATISKMATNKIDKLLMVSNFNENWYLTQNFPNNPISEFRAPTNSSLQNTPRYQFSLKSETIDNLTILLAAILKMVACCRVMYCYSIIITSPRLVGWCIAILRFFFTIIIITSPRLLSVMYCYSTFLFHYYYSYSYYYSSTHFCPLYSSEMPKFVQPIPIFISFH
jgi:hypothetical protein